jgi:putative tryptophan/tyrosine transport system substrate-binding protein
MRRREFITLLGGAAAIWPLAARARQLSRVLRLGVVGVTPRTGPLWAAFEQRLRELDYVDGKNLAVEFIQVNLQDDTIRAAMTKLVGDDVDIIVTGGNEFVARAALRASRVIPIVIVAIDYDPLALGYIASLARPGGNVTGLFFEQIDLMAKRLQLIKEAASGSQNVVVFWDRASDGQWQAAQRAAPALQLQVAGVELSGQPYDYERALRETAHNRSALLVTSSPVFFNDRNRLSEITLRHRLPAAFSQREFAAAGGLLSYGPDFIALFRRVAEYADRIAKGAKPADLPVQQPTKFQLVINLKTAKALGLTLPQTLVVTADEVIE